MDYSHRENQNLKNKEIKNTKQNNQNPKLIKKNEKSKEPRRKKKDYTILYIHYTIVTIELLA